MTTAATFGFVRKALLLMAASVLAACGAPAQEPKPSSQPATALLPTSSGALGRIEIRQIAARPRLTLVSRDGDPMPALVVMVATDLPPVATTTLAAVVEERLKRGGFEVDSRVDRSAFRIRWLAGDAGRLDAFFAAVSLAFRQPVTAGSAELAAAAQRLQSLRRHPLDAPEMIPIAACNGQLGIAGNEPVPDVTSAAGARDADLWRKTALQAARTSVAAVGTAPFCTAASRALETAEGWAAGTPATDAWPAAEPVGAYVLPGASPGVARLTVAVRVGDVHAAIAAAERLGAASSPLHARLQSLPLPFHPVEIAGVARPRGGCVGVTLETTSASPAGDSSLEAAAALATAVVRQEIRTELAGPSSPGIAARLILAAADPREAASRAAWWALAGSVPSMPPRAAVALGYPPGGEQGTGARERFEAELGRALAMTGAPIAERRMTVERGQGELWLLVASPCGTADEGSYDAGATALSALAAVAARRGGTVAVEPWITADGIGVIAHASQLDGGESPSALARRIADAAASTVAATELPAESVAAARTLALEHLERTAGRHAAALEALTGAVLRDHPSWLDPFGAWSRIAGTGPQASRLRWQAIAQGPIRLAVLANSDDAQAATAAEAVDRWFIPRDKPRPCRGGEPSPVRPGRYETRLPSGTPLAQAMIGLPAPPVGAADHPLADLTALALDGKGGLLQTALGTRPGATASARILGGSRAAAIVIDIRVPSVDLEPAVADVRALLLRLAQSGATDSDLGRALAASAKRTQERRATSRGRLIDLWLQPSPAPAADKSPAPSRAAWNTWMAAALRESSWVIVQARPE